MVNLYEAVSRSQAIRDMYDGLGRNTTTREVISELGKRGIKVSKDLVRVTLTRHTGKHWSNVTTESNGQAATAEPKLSRMAQIKIFLKKYPKEKPKDIAVMMAVEGIEGINTNLISKAGIELKKEKAEKRAAKNVAFAKDYGGQVVEVQRGSKKRRTIRNGVQAGIANGFKMSVEVPETGVCLKLTNKSVGALGTLMLGVGGMMFIKANAKAHPGRSLTWDMLGRLFDSGLLG